MTDTPQIETRPFIVGEFRIDPSLGRVSGDNGPVSLEPKTMEVLCFLASRPGEVVSADQLIDVVWKGRPMGDNPVYRCVSQLRKVFGDSSRESGYIETVPKRGYRLVADVERIDSRDRVDPGEPASAPSDTRGRWFARSATAIGFVSLAIVAIVAGVLLLEPGSESESESDPEPAGVEAARPPTLAVLPFDIDGERAPGLVSGANLARAITERLASERELRVIAHDSAAVVERSGADPVRAAETLGADFLLLGVVEQEPTPGEVRLTLLDASGGTIWRSTVGGPLGNSGSVLEQILLRLADHFGLSAGSQLHTGCRGARSRQACQYYLLAHEHLLDRNASFRTAAIDLMQQAIAEDPTFAAAHADLAMLYLMPGAQRPWRDVMALASAAIDRALELDPQLAEAHAARGLLMMRDPDWPCPPDCFRLDLEASESSLRKAVELNPSFARAHGWLAVVNYIKGDFRAAQARLERALGFDPMNPVLHNNLAIFSAFRGEPDEAIRTIDAFRAFHPDPPAYLGTSIAGILDLFGQYDRAARVALGLDPDSTEPSFNYAAANAYLNLGLLDDVEHQILLAESDRLIGSGTLSLRWGLHRSRGDDAALSRLAARLRQESNSTYGDPARWPRGAVLNVGRQFSLVGEHRLAVEFFDLIEREPLGTIDYQSVIDELDGLLFHAHSLFALEREDDGRRFAGDTLEILAAMDRQGYGELPDLMHLKALGHALLGERALAVAGLRRAVSRGWLRHWQLKSDERWSALRGEADFEQLMADIHDRIIEQRASLGAFAARPFAMENGGDSGILRQQ